MRPDWRFFLFVAAAVMLAETAGAESPEFPPAENLKRGRFQLAAINRDETRLLTATWEIAQLWDLKAGVLLAQFDGHKAPIHTICFSPDERRILTGGGKTTEHGDADDSVRLWEAATGKSVAILTTVGKNLVDEIGTSPSVFVSSARYSPDGQHVLAIMDSGTSIPDAAVLWNLENQQIDLVVSRISTYSGVTMSYEPVQFSPDGQWLLGLVEKASQVVIWNAKTGDVRRRFDAPDDANQDEERGRLGKVQFSPSGKLVLAVAGDRTVRIWDVPSGKEIQVLQGHEDRICVARFFAGETQALTAAEDKTVRLWEVQSGKQLQQWDYSGPVQEMSASPDGQRLLTRTIQLHPNVLRNRWFGELRDLKTGQSLRTWELPPMWIAENEPLNAYRSSVLSPSGRLVLTTVWTDGEVGVTLIDAEAGAVKKRFE